MRINFFKQIRGFYSSVMSGNLDIKPTHISLYMFLLNQNNRVNWVEWFKVPFDTAMNGACINSKKTYYSVLNDLQDFGFIEYEKGSNHHKAPKIRIVPLQADEDITPTPEKDFSSVENTPLTTQVITQLTTPLTTQQCEQLDTQLCELLWEHKDRLLTDNLVTGNSQKEPRQEEPEQKELFTSFPKKPTKEKAKTYIQNHGYPSDFEELYDLSFKKQDKLAALTHWMALTESEREAVKNHWPEYARLKNDKFQKLFRTYLDDRGWEMDLSQFKQSTKRFGIFDD